MPARRSARRLPLLFPSRRIDPFAAKRTRIHVSRFVTMPKIERRPLTDGAERWQWPAGMHRVLRQVLARRPLRGTEELALSLAAMTPVGRFEALGAAVELLLEHRGRSIVVVRSEEHTSELQSRENLVCRLLL